MIDARQGLREASLEPPKETTSRIASPPPAYAPPFAQVNSIPPLTLPQLTALRVRRAEAEASYRSSTCTTSSGAGAAPRDCMSQPIAAADADDDDDGRDDDNAQSPICLRINTSINITQSNNIICLSDTPAAEHATAIASAVVKAMQENSSGNCGIPMIDEDGRPRPIKIEVDASMLVEGSGNILGSSPVISEFLRQRALRRSRQSSQEVEDQETSMSVKRRRISIGQTEPIPPRY